MAHLEVVGSATSAEFNPDFSDFDFLVELDQNNNESRGRRWTELADALEALLGRHVDLLNPRYIRNPYFLQAVNRSRTVIYDRQNAAIGGGAPAWNVACARLARMEPALIKSVANLKLAIDLRNRISHGYDAVDAEIVYFTVLEDLPSLRLDLTQLLALRG